MANQIQTIEIDRLIAHPDNPNRMSKDRFAKLVRNIERTGRYEPIVVRPKGFAFEIINGHHRVKALQQLGHKTADVVVWEVDDHEADILLATLNRLAGSDVLEKKLALLKRLNEQTKARELARLLPHNAKQIERLTNLKLPTAPAEIDANCFAIPLMFFVNNEQHKIIRHALSLVQSTRKETTKAKRNAAALTRIARSYIDMNKNLRLSYSCHPELNSPCHPELNSPCHPELNSPCHPELNSPCHPERSEGSGQDMRLSERDINSLSDPDSSAAPQNDKKGSA